MNARSRSLFLHHMAILCFQVLSWLWFEHWHSHVSYLPRLFEYKHLTVNNLLIFLHFIHSSVYHSVWIVVNFYATMHQIHFFLFFVEHLSRAHTQHFHIYWMKWVLVCVKYEYKLVSSGSKHFSATVFWMYVIVGALTWCLCSDHKIKRFVGGENQFILFVDSKQFAIRHEKSSDL